MIEGHSPGTPLYSLAWMREWYVAQGAYVVAFIGFLFALVSL